MIWFSLATLVFAGLSIPGVHSQAVFCYYTSWPQYRPDPAKFFPENIDASMCNYAVFAFAFLENNELIPYEWNDVEMYGRINNLKSQNANLKTLLAVGGWTMDMYEAGKMMSTAANRNHFVTTSYSYVSQYGFDGLDLDFEYPASRNSSDKPQERELFTELVRELKEYYTSGGRNKLVTAAVAAGKDTIERGYEIYDICQYLDYINIMAYDYNGAWDPTTHINAPMCPTTADYDEGDKAYWNMQSTAYIWANCGCPKQKMNIGMPTYGRSYTLASGANRGVGAPATGAAAAGKYTREPGFHSYYEICSIIRGTDGVTVSDVQQNFDSTIQCPYISYLDTTAGEYQFIGYDNQESLGRKISWVKEQGFGGFMVWSYDLDDFSGQSIWCGSGAYPLISYMKSQWANPSYTSSQTACDCSLPAPGVPNSCGAPPPQLPVPPEVACYGSVQPTGAPTTPTTPPVSDCSSAKVGISGRCEEYFCESEQRRCPAGQRFDSGTLQCTGTRAGATCTGGDPSIPGTTCSSNDGLYSLENHCTFYVNCVFGVGSLQHCGDNNVFSSSLGTCVDPAFGEGICQG